MTEAANLAAAAEAARTWNLVDSDRIVLLRESQGGMACAACAARDPESFAGLVLLYPALTIPDMVRDLFPAFEDISATYAILGTFSGGHEFAEDVRTFMMRFPKIQQFEKSVPVLHRDIDPLVPLSYSQRARDVYSDAQFIVPAGAEHGFEGVGFESAISHNCGLSEEDRRLF